MARLPLAAALNFILEKEFKKMKKGDIYLLRKREKPKGNIQAGTRPVIIIQNNTGNKHSKTVIVCSISSTTKPYLPTHANLEANGGLKKESRALCEQIFTINKTQLSRYIGTIENPQVLNRLNKCIQISLGIKGENKCQQIGKKQLQNIHRVQTE